MKEQILTQDRRIRKSKKSIKSALIDLLAEKDISQITIKELAEKADVNRNTFYGHYDTTYDVISDIENDIVADINGIISGNDYIDKNFNPSVIFEKITVLINDNYDFYSQLNTSIGTASLHNKIKNILRDKILEILSTTIGKNKNNLSLVVEFACSGTISVYQNWLNSAGTLSIENISNEISKLSLACMNCLESEA